ncbi:MAG: hypothetical protein K1W02_05810 [Muribaculaceae bacterium]
MGRHLVGPYVACDIRHAGYVVEQRLLAEYQLSRHLPEHSQRYPRLSLPLPGISP